MIHRALLHVAGPPGVGKSTFVERFLERELALAICVRAEQDTELRREEETAPKRHSELSRYRESGASDAVLDRFPRPDTDAFLAHRRKQPNTGCSAIGSGASNGRRS